MELFRSCRIFLLDFKIWLLEDSEERGEGILEYCEVMVSGSCELGVVER